jgi:hypothetical protein
MSNGQFVGTGLPERYYDVLGKAIVTSFLAEVFTAGPYLRLSGGLLIQDLSSPHNFTLLVGPANISTDNDEPDHGGSWLGHGLIR